ncbi:MAG: hypothetical protein FWD89_00095 [Firmicutes bacterium]|nr:hypothetical protein [Bacillota bacterium]
MKTIGIIELNSSHTKLTISKRTGDTFFTKIDEVVDYINIGEEATNDPKGYFIKPQRVAEVLEILKGYQKLVNSYMTDEVFVYATHAIKNAKNNQSLIAEVGTLFGWKARILTMEEEVGYVQSAVFNTIEAPKALVAIVNPTSIELVLYSRRNIQLKKVIDFGPENIAKENKGSQKDLAKILEEKIKKELAAIEEIKEIEPDFSVVAVGYAAEALARVSHNQKKYSLDIVHNYTLDKKDVRKAEEFLLGLEVDANKKLRGISEERADIVPLGVVALRTIFESTELEAMTISTHGLTYGAMLSHINPSIVEKPINDLLGYSLDKQFEEYEASQTNSKNVYNIAMILFKELRVLHKLPRTYVKSLRVASFMHDAGKRIGFDNHQKNAFPIILASELFGLTHRELLVAAFSALSEISTNLNPTELTRHREIITTEDIDAIKKLGSIIRLAENMDKCYKNLVKDINCDILGDSVILKIETDQDASFEIKEALKAKTDFFRAFGRTLELL